MNPKKNVGSENTIKVYEGGLYITYPVMTKYVIQVLLLIATGVSIYFTLKFTYIDEKIALNRTQIEKLDSEKVSWKDYGNWQRAKEKAMPFASLLKDMNNKN
jgi:hypothetical protein